MKINIATKVIFLNLKTNYIKLLCTLNQISILKSNHNIPVNNIFMQSRESSSELPFVQMIHTLPLMYSYLMLSKYVASWLD